MEYKDGYEELSAIAGDFGFGIGRLRSTSQEAARLRHELYQCTRRKRQIVVDGDNCELHGRTYDSFGEPAYRIRPRRSATTSSIDIRLSVATRLLFPIQELALGLGWSAFQ